jgi:hypothetical protein
MKRALGIFIVIGLVFCFSGVASARTHKMMTYRYSQVWRTAVRFLRVDRRCPIVEKDKKDGYVLFEYRDEGKDYHGSLELVPTSKDGKKYIRVALRIEDMPTYVESLFLDKLKQKLRQDYGDAPTPQLVEAAPDKSAKKSKKEKDAEDDESEENEDQEKNDTEKE